MKNFSAFCLLLTLFYVRLDGTAAETSPFIKDVPLVSDCPLGAPPSVCTRRLLMFPFPRVGRRQDPSFVRESRVFGLVKQPRVGRSDPLLSVQSLGNRRGSHEPTEDAWLDTVPDYPGNMAYHRRVPGEREENLRNLQTYLSAHRRDSNAPWAFFLITPNFQSTDHQQSIDNLIPQLGHEADDLNEE